MRELQGLPARMPDRRRHGEDEDRVPAPLAARARAVAAGPADRAPAALGAVGRARCRGSPTCATRCPGAARLAERVAGTLRAALAAALARATRSCGQRGDSAATTRRGGADVVLLVDTFNNYFEPENAHAALARAAGRRLSRARRARRGATTRSATGRCAAAAPFSRAGLVDEAKREARRIVDALAPHVGARRDDRRPRAVVPAVAARRIPRDGPRRRRAAAGGARAADRGVPGARAARPAGSSLPLARAAAEARAAARPLPPEGVRRDERRSSTVLRLDPRPRTSR